MSEGLLKACHKRNSYWKSSLNQSKAFDKEKLLNTRIVWSGWSPPTHSIPLLDSPHPNPFHFLNCLNAFVVENTVKYLCIVTLKFCQWYAFFPLIFKAKYLKWIRFIKINKQLHYNIYLTYLLATHGKNIKTIIPYTMIFTEN